MSNHIDIHKMKEYSNKLKLLFDEMELRLIERDQAIRLIALTFFAKTNCFILGERGVAKSYAVELLGNVIKGTKKLWQLLLKHDTKDEEIFGRTYKDDSNGELKINTKNSLLEAHNIFLDEMFKAQGKVLSGLLELLVDRSYSFGDGQKIKTKIIAVFGVSNEYPTGHFMLPYVDRFLIWIVFKEIKKEENKIRFFLDDFVKEPVDGEYFDHDDINFIYTEVEKVNFSTEKAKLYSQITTELQQNKVKTSDRKYKSIIRLMKTIAYLNGRTEVNYSDMFILLHSAWHNEEEKISVREKVSKHMFSTTEEINRRIHSVDKSIEVSNTDYKQYLYNLIEYKNVYSGEKAFLNFKNDLENLRIQIENYDVMYEKDIAKLIDMNNFNKNVEKELNENLFIIGEKDEIFTFDHLEKINNQITIIEKDKKICIEWLNLNSKLHNYQANKFSIDSKTA